MARTLHLIVCLTAAMMVSASRYRLTPWPVWPSYEYESQIPMETTHERMRIRSTGPWNGELMGTHYVPKVVDRRSNMGSLKILNRNSKPVSITRRRGDSGDRVVFPDARTEVYAMSRKALPECNELGKLCEQVDHYPTDVADKIIQKLGDNIKLLTMDQLDEPETPEITQRISGEGQQQDLCFLQSKITFPKGGYDKDNKYHLVVNNDKNPVQGFKVEICNATDVPCKSFVNVSGGYQSRCIQKYVYRSMLTIDNATLTETHTPIAVPSCCSCVAKSIPF